MKLRGIDFGYVMNASGARNFFGDGYWFHRKLRPFGLDYTGSTFVAKTTPLYAREGNMPLNPVTLQPRDLFPDCIKAKVRSGAALNAVGLSSPGAKDLLERGLWQQRSEAFFISFAAIKETVAERLNEWRAFITLLQKHLSKFHASIGLEMNFSCPNTRIAEKPFVDEILAALGIASVLGIPLVPKINVLVPPVIGLQIARHPACDAVCQSNTIPWGELSNHINWEKIFGQKESPLAKYGGGGLSGPHLFPLVVDWIHRIRRLGLNKPIIACGGINSPRKARIMLDAGAQAIQIGSVSFTRPLRVRHIIRCANAYAKKIYGA